MNYPQSFYADLFDSYLTNAERVDASLPPRAERIKVIAAEIDRNDSASVITAETLCAGSTRPFLSEKTIFNCE